MEWTALCPEGCFESNRGKLSRLPADLRVEIVSHSKNPYGENGGDDPSIQDQTTYVFGEFSVAQQLASHSVNISPTFTWSRDC